MKLFSPSKINLFLSIRSKRPDGFHEIETLFERISLGDWIRLEPHPSEIRIKSSSKNIPLDGTNLACRAAQLLKDEYKVPSGVCITLEKKTPVAAGLGGGSSNAATVLLGLNKLWKLKIPRKKLAALGARLGSDVSFFVLDVPLALGTGRGEKLKALPAPKRKIWHCLVKPDFGISTKEAYGALRASFLTPQKTNVKMLLQSIQKGDSRRLSGLLKNSLELTLNTRVTTILKIKEELIRQGALGSLMSGSGSTVFGIFNSEQKARKASLFFKKYKAWKVYVASTF